MKTQIKVKNINTRQEVKFIDKQIKKLNYLNFKGEKGQIEINNNIIYVGIKGIIEKSEWREIGYKLTQFINTLNIKEISIKIPLNSKEFIEGLLLGRYEFNKYKSVIKKSKLKNIYIYTNSKQKNKQLKEILVQAQYKIKAQFITKDWVNTTPEEANSETIKKAVLKEFQNSSNIKITVYEDKDLKKFGMKGHLAVNRASRHGAKTIKIEYIPTKKPKKNIVLIGKGLTYDSGGLSIKPSQSMTTMKADKAGAMSVFGIMKGLSNLQSENKVVAYMGIAENMIDGSAYKPDDVITMMNGKTVHIKNTDAEGRIVLFDNICLAEKENKKIDEIYSFATLTGAAVYQFNGEACGMVGFNDKMKRKIKKIGLEEDEIFMDAEFHKYMLNGVNDSLADLSNTGTPNMGCQKAGLFLTNALNEKNKKKYLHLDIAGPAFVSQPFGVNDAEATGFAVRTFINYLTKK